MNTRKIIASLNQIANKLDNNGLFYISDKLTNTMVKISQSFSENLQWKSDYSAANQAAKQAGLRNDINPEAFYLLQLSLKNKYNKGEIRQLPLPSEIGRMMAKTPIDINELRYSLSPRTKSIFVTNPPPGTRVEFNKTEGMTEDELINDYVWLVGKKLEKHDLEGALDWNDKAKEKLSSEAYEKFDKKQQELYDEYAQWEADHPEMVAEREKRRTTTTPQASSLESSPVKDSSGLDRWVNKAENIYKSWSDKNMPENSTAPLLIKDVLDYMVKVKNNLPIDKAADAQSKIDLVQSFINNIRDKKPHTGSVKSYSEFTGFGGKEADPFGKNRRLDQKKLDYLAQQESKTY